MEIHTKYRGIFGPTKWVHLSRQENVRVTVTRVAVGKVPLKAIGDSSQSADDLVQIEVLIENLDDGKKINYRTWGSERIGFGSDKARLSDDIDNTYARISFGFGTNVVGAVNGSDSIYPEKSLSDVLVFEPPVDKAKELRLELPAAAFEGTGMLRFKIPATMISRQ